MQAAVIVDSKAHSLPPPCAELFLLKRPLPDWTGALLGAQHWAIGLLMLDGRLAIELPGQGKNDSGPNVARVSYGWDGFSCQQRLGRTDASLEEMLDFVVAWEASHPVYHWTADNCQLFVADFALRFANVHLQTQNAAIAERALLPLTQSALRGFLGNEAALLVAGAAYYLGGSHLPPNIKVKRSFEALASAVAHC